MEQSRRYEGRRIRGGRRLGVLSAWLAVLLSSAPVAADDTTDFRITFDLDAQQRTQRASIEQVYADELAAITAGSDEPVRIGIGALIGSPPSANQTAIAGNSIWALFDHPNACNADGCRLVHLYREETTGDWMRGFDGYATGELIRFYPFTGIGRRVGCIQMKGAALILFAWDEEMVAPGARC